jgi:hypothetical protein
MISSVPSAFVYVVLMFTKNKLNSYM